MTKQTTKKINLALQGGGAHGAFTWGVLDYLLESNKLDFEAITATSAGCMNAAVMLQGLTKGGHDGGREALQKFWEAISAAGSVFSPVQRSPFESLMGLNPFASHWGLENSLSFKMMDMALRTWSPYQFNPYNINPLRELIESTIDFECLRACNHAKLFVTATNVRTGEAKIFETHEMTADVLLASAALPFLFHAVEIDGDHYWDGGYMGNPSLWPLFYRAKIEDVLIIHVNPMVRNDVPMESYAIDNRINEITFNASLLKELRAIAFVQKLLRDDMIKPEFRRMYKDIRLHAIRAEESMKDLSVASKFDTSWAFLTHLRDIGRDMARDWLDGHYDAVGHRATVNISKDYLNPKLKKA
jgi:NTE family protein